MELLLFRRFYFEQEMIVSFPALSSRLLLTSLKSGASYSIKRLENGVYIVKRLIPTKTECNQSELNQLKIELSKLKSEKESLDEQINNLKNNCQDTKSQFTPEQKQRTNQQTGSYRTWSNGNQLYGKSVQPTAASSAKTPASQNPRYPIVRFNIGFT